MSYSKFNIYEVSPDRSNALSTKDSNLVTSFLINNTFDPSKHYVEQHIYSLDGDLLQSNYNYINQSFYGDAGTVGTSIAKGLSLDPEFDAKQNGYDYGGIIIYYNFLDDLYSNTTSRTSFFVEEISQDRTEIRLLTSNISDQALINFTADTKKKIEASSYILDLNLNFSNNVLLPFVNIGTQTYNGNTSVIIKLYQPLPLDIELKQLATINELVSDTVGYEVDVDIIEDEIIVPYIKGPNFNFEAISETNISSTYFNFDELFDYPVSNNYRELTSLFQEKGINVSIDYSDYSNFIHFSSANERLRNFKYKLDLIEHYQNQIDTLEAGTSVENGISGSREYYHNAINSILGNFDHYDRYLYYESSSYAWPKTTSVRPYTNDTTSATGSWYTEFYNSSSLFDSINPHILINSIPSYLREDSSNETYNIFIHMLGQHFDNIWIYTNAVTDKYDGDNRIDRGISRDLVADALRNFGIKLYTSNRSTENLFKAFTGELYDTGSENISTFISASDDIVSEELYRKETYKRLYHNLPLLLKAKGSERGLRALITSFGIPTLYSSGSHQGLTPMFFGGVNRNNETYLNPSSYYSSSFEKIRLDDTGSIISGSTLSQNTSIVKREYTYTDDLHPVEVGFSPSTYIDKSLYLSASVDGFNIDQYIGDPRLNYSSSYDTLISASNSFLKDREKYDLQDYTRLIKFYDNTIFKMVKDFLPARSSISSGIVIKPHLLERPKIKQVQVFGDQKLAETGSQDIVEQFIGDITLTGSISIAEISGSHGGSFRFGGNDLTASGEYSASYTSSVLTPLGLATYEYHNHEEAKFDGEFSGSQVVISTGELNDENRFKYDNAILVRYALSFYSSSDAQPLSQTPTPTPTPTPTITPTITPTPSSSPPSNPSTMTMQTIVNTGNPTFGAKIEITGTKTFDLTTIGTNTDTQDLLVQSTVDGTGAITLTSTNTVGIIDSIQIYISSTGFALFDPLGPFTVNEGDTLFQVIEINNFTLGEDITIEITQG